MEGAIRGLLIERSDGFPSGFFGLAKEGVVDSLNVACVSDAVIASDLHRNDQNLHVAIGAAWEVSSRIIDIFVVVFGFGRGVMFAVMVIDGDAQMLTRIVNVGGSWGKAIKDPDEGSKVAA